MIRAAGESKLLMGHICDEKAQGSRGVPSFGIERTGPPMDGSQSPTRAWCSHVMVIEGVVQNAGYMNLDRPRYTHVCLGQERSWLADHVASAGHMGYVGDNASTSHG